MQTIEPGKLTAWVAEYPPFVSNQDGTLTGIDGELLTRVAKALCLELSPDTQQFAAVLEGIKSGRADISAGEWILNDDRAATYEVSDPEYASAGGIISAAPVTAIDELAGKKIGVVTGYFWNDDLIKIFGDNVRSYDSEQAVYDDIKAGRLDAGVFGQGSGTLLLEADAGTNLVMSPLPVDDRISFTVNPALGVVLMSKGNTALKEAVNIVLKEYRDSGDLATALQAGGIAASNATPSAAPAE